MMGNITVKGSSWDAEDTILVDNIAELKDVIKQSGIIWIKGLSTTGDGGYGSYCWDSTKLITSANDITIVAPNSIPVGVTTGCWVLNQVSTSQDNCRAGFFDYNDLATVTTPLVVTTALGEVAITNDGLGPQTIKTFAPDGVTDVWDTATNMFDFSQLANGDMVDIRLALEITTTGPSQSVNVDMHLGIGGVPYTIPFASAVVKSTGTYIANRFNGIYMADDNTRLNAANFVITSDGDATVKVVGWYCKVLLRG